VRVLVPAGALVIVMSAIWVGALVGLNVCALIGEVAAPPVD
jgi:hypothetical protein